MNEFKIKIIYKPMDIEKKLKEGEDVVKDELRNTLETLREETTSRATKKAPVDRSTLRRSLQPGHAQTLTKTLQTKAIVGSKLVYAAPHEYGTRPFWPPHKPIKKWVWRNRGKFGVKTHSEASRVVYFVRKKIAQKGIREKRYLRDALEETIRRAKRVVEHHANRILERLGLK